MSDPVLNRTKGNIMKVRITDIRVPGEELILKPGNQELDDVHDSPQLSKKGAFKVIEFWEDSDQVGTRGSFDLTDEGIIVLGEVESIGDEIEMMAWYVGDSDCYLLATFPSTSLHWEVIPDGDEA